MDTEFKQNINTSDIKYCRQKIDNEHLKKYIHINNDTLIGEHFYLKNSLNKRNNENKNLKKELKKREKELNNKINELNIYINENKEQEQINLDLEKRKETDIHQHKIYRGNIIHLQKQKKEIEEEIHKVQNELKNLSEEKKSLTDQLTETTELTKTQKEENEQLIYKISETEKELTDKIKIVRFKDEEIKKEKEESNKLLRANIKIIENLKKVEKQINILSEEKEKIIKDSETKLKIKDDEINKIKSESEQQQSDFIEDAKLSYLKHFNNYKKKQEDEKSNLLNKINNLESTVINLESTLESEKKQKTELESLITEKTDTEYKQIFIKNNDNEPKNNINEDLDKIITEVEKIYKSNIDTPNKLKSDIEDKIDYLLKIINSRDPNQRIKIIKEKSTIKVDDKPKESICETTDYMVSLLVNENKCYPKKENNINNVAEIQNNKLLNSNSSDDFINIGGLISDNEKELEEPEEPEDKQVIKVMKRNPEYKNKMNNIFKKGGSMKQKIQKIQEINGTKKLLYKNEFHTITEQDINLNDEKEVLKKYKKFTTKLYRNSKKNSK